MAALSDGLSGARAWRRPVLGWVLAGSLGLMGPGLAFAVEAPAAVQLDPAVEAYLELALTRMQTYALHGSRVDWAALRRQLRPGLVGAESSIETYAALRQALAALDDKHSFLQLPDALELAEAQWQSRKAGAGAGAVMAGAVAEASAQAPAAPVSELVLRRKASLQLLARPGQLGPVALINVPAHPAQEGLDEDATALDALLQEAAAAGARDWIIDLRGNGGGNVFPMLAGLSALLGDGDMVITTRSDGRRMAFGLQRGVASLQDFDGKQQPVCRLLSPVRPLAAPRRLAVLMDRNTGSSGEIVAMALRTMPGSRFFGERSFGATTATDGFRLPDGANLVLAVGLNADRQGRSYPQGIPVDEPSPALMKLLPAAQDGTVQQALRWLMGR